MKTQEEHVQEAAVAQEKLHQIVVAAGILTEQEAKDYLIVRAGDKSKLPVNLPADAVPHECSSCGCDTTMLEIGIDKAVGEVRFHAIIALIQDVGQEN